MTDTAAPAPADTSAPSPAGPTSTYAGPRPDQKAVTDPGDASPIGDRDVPFVPVPQQPYPYGVTEVVKLGP